MAQWKKVIVSGSSISQLANDLGYLRSGDSNVILTGSFKGDGSGLTGLAADSIQFANVLNKPTLVSSSAQISISSTSGFTSFSSSLASDIAANASAIAGLGSTYATDAELSAVSGALAAAISGLDGDFATDAQLSAVSGALASAVAANASAIAGLNSTYATDAELSAVSGALAASISSISTDFADIQNKPTLISSSVEGDAQGQIKLNGVNVDINGLGSTDSPQFANVTITGDLNVSGTVTNVNTTDLNIEDKFILLNSGSASGNSGLIVQNSATTGQGTALFFDDTANRWALDYAGADAVADTATADAFVAAVVTSDDANYRHVGNIRVQGGEIFIYV